MDRRDVRRRGTTTPRETIPRRFTARRTTPDHSNTITASKGDAAVKSSCVQGT